MGRRRRGYRSNSGLGAVVGDSVAIANYFGPKGALITGIIGFVIFYFLFPALLEGWAAHNKAKMSGPMAPIFANLLDEVFFHRFVHPCEWAGIAILLVCTSVATWKAVVETSLTTDEERSITVIGRLLARFID